MGGILVDSISSFHTTLPVQSALVVGKSFMEPILYMPIANHTRFSPMKINFGSCKSTPSNCRNVFDTENKDVKGDNMAELVMLMLKILSWFPDMYIMKAFIRICFPGADATLKALAFFLESRAMCCCCVSVDVPPDECVACFSYCKTAFIPIGTAQFWMVS